MQSNDSLSSRRRFLKLACVVVGAGTLARSARADDLPHLAETDPTAAALGYKEDASQVDPAKAAQKKPGAVCGNCQFFSGGGAFGPCQLFPGKAVSAKGWCSAHAPRP